MHRSDFNNDWYWIRESGEEIKVQLPHDAMQYAKREKDAPSAAGCAYYKGGLYCYKRFLYAPDEWKNQQVIIQFEGIYQKSTIKVNGHLVGGSAYGYIPLWVDISKYLKYGQKNVIEVKADNSKMPNSRWYSGGGLYRPAWLWTGRKNGLLPENLKISTISYNPARIRIRIDKEVDGDIEYTIQEDGETVATAHGRDVQIEIQNAKLWDDKHPALYQCIAQVKIDGKEVDRTESTFGIRKLEWSNQGFFVNGRKVLLRGGCIHHDNGILGARSYKESEWRKVKRLKSVGFNALRSSHNPANPALIEACDAQGMYLIDEGWDMWYKHKNIHDYAENFEVNWQHDLTSIVLRDYNHPSVIMYSIGNEVSEPATERGIELAREMVNLIHKIDTGRAVTGGMNIKIIADSAKGIEIYQEGGGRDTSSEKMVRELSSQMFNEMMTMIGKSKNNSANTDEADAAISPVLDTLDIAGYNYGTGRYLLEKEKHPNRVIYGSETLMPDLPDNWKMIEENAYLIGDFMWTAWDYIGEAGSGAWVYSDEGKGFEKPFPWLLAEMGAIDILGNPGGEAFWAGAVWRKADCPTICVQPVNHPEYEAVKSCWRGTNAIPSWSWRNCEGNNAIVEVYGNGSEATLFLNEKIVGKSKIINNRAIFDVAYEPGELYACIKTSTGEEIISTKLRSANEELRIVAVCEDKLVENSKLHYIDLYISDENGVVESNSDRVLHAKVSGGSLLGFGSALPRSEDSFLSGSYQTYYGKAQAVVQKTAEICQLIVSGEGLDTIEVDIK